MTQLVGYDVEGGVAVLTMQHPPTNTLTAPLRAALLEALQQALDDAMVGAIALVGKEHQFSSGRDYGELGKPIVAPSLADLCLAFEDAQKPVVVGLAGVVLGAGLELALACHYRVALHSARVAMPEAALGLCPGAGGTQRAPRLIGTDAALELFLSGRVMPVDCDAMRGMTDEVTPQDVREATIVFALKCIASHRPVRRTCEITTHMLDIAAHQAAIAKWTARLPKTGEAASDAILQCVDAAPLLPFDVGMAFERDRFEDLVQSDQSRALRHVALAERRATRFPEARRAKARPVHRIGIIGDNSIATTLAIASLRAGFDVTLVAQNDAAMVRSMARVENALRRLSAAGRIPPDKEASMLEKIQAHPDLLALSEDDIVIEAEGQGTEISRQILTQLDGIVKDGAVLVVHDARASVDTLSLVTGCPEDVVGLFVVSTAQNTLGVEVAVGQNSGAEAVVTLLAFLSKIDQIPVRAKAYPGLIGQSVAAACVRAAEDLIWLGASPFDIDQVMRAWGMVQGPFQIADAMGLDAPGMGLVNGSLSGVLLEQGRGGRAERSGWYRYDQTHPFGVKDQETWQVIVAALPEIGTDTGAFPPNAREIEATCLAAMVNAGARLLRQGVASHPSDIDVAMIRGYGFPRWRGGPMQAADLAGLMSVRAVLRQMAESGDAFWRPEPLFDTLIKNGRQIGALNG